MAFMRYIFSGILVILFMNGIALASHHHDSESNKPSGDGHCKYMADNPFAGDAYKACRTNVSESFCKAFSEVGDGVVTILDPKYGEGDCPRQSSIGSCERGGWEEVYYEDSNQGPMGVEFGCNFAGDWIKPQEGSIEKQKSTVIWMISFLLFVLIFSYALIKYTRREAK